MELRDYQAEFLDKVQGVYRSGRRRVLGVAPTGAGKSAMTRYMLGRTNKRALILCHRGELQDMICEGLGRSHGVIGGKGWRPTEQVDVGMMQTVARRLDALPRYDWIISDEAHLAMCATWRSILQHYDRAWHLGLSATPCRLDGQGLGAEYESIVMGPTIRELTERGFLVPSRVFAPVTRELNLKRPGGQYSLSDDALALDRASVTGDVIEHYKRLAGGRQGIVFASSIDHGKHVAQQFSAAGIPAVFVDGTMSRTDQRAAVAAYKARRFMLLVNVELLTTGFDCPQIEVAIFLRRTKSLALFLQMVGRVLRLCDGKREAILLDHVGNTLEHGMPDADREWTLDGRERRTTAISIAQCPRCYAVHRPAPRCTACGHVYAFAAASRGQRAPEARDGALEQVDGQTLSQLGGDKLQAALKAARGKPTDHERRAALEIIRKAMGYKPAWTFMQLQMLRRFRRGKPSTVSRQAHAG